MKQFSQESAPDSLPITRSLTLVYGLSLAVALLMTGASVAGLLAPDALYPTAALRQSSVPNDAVNLLLGLPILLVAMALARRSQWLGLLFWPGALLYVLYNTLVYVFAMPLGWMTAIYAALALLSAITPVVLIARVDRDAVRQQFAGTVPARVPGGALVGFGALFLLILVLLLRPLLTSAPFVLADVIVIAGMTLICVVPFALFTRGVLSQQG